MRKLVLVAATATIGCGLVACKDDGGDGGGGPPQPMTMMFDNLDIPAGETMNVASTTTLVVAGQATIAGRIAAQGNQGQSIVIVAEQGVTISGELVAGTGAEAASGGTVMITSNNGDITLTDTAAIRAGDGGATPSAARSTAGGAGADGGHIILNAPNGTINLAQKADLLTLGAGRNGQDLLAPNPLDAPTGQLENRGGNGGAPIALSANISVGTTTVAAPFDIVSPSGEVLIAAQGELRGINPAGIAAGGAAGDAGRAQIGMPPGQGLVARGLRTTQVPPELPDLEIVGADGGTSFLLNGGDGQDVFVFAQDGMVPGQNGQSVEAKGGMAGEGGVIILGLGADPGDGGDCEVTGGTGARGAVPGGKGGDGGDADCTSGQLTFLFAGEDGPPFAGTAKAFGGFGAAGGTGCVTPPQMGGQGGEGGDAIANQVNLTANSPVEVLAVGGKGGGGAFGEPPGDVGEGGSARAQFELTENAGMATSRDGEDGDQGGTCPPAPPPDAGIPPDTGIIPDSGTPGTGNDCSCDTPGRTLSVVSGCENFMDAMECSGWQSVIIGSENGNFTPEEEEEARTRVVASGTSFCAFGCCIQITCP